MVMKKTYLYVNSSHFLHGWKRNVFFQQLLSIISNAKVPLRKALKLRRKYSVNIKKILL